MQQGLQLPQCFKCIQFGALFSPPKSAYQVPSLQRRKRGKKGKAVHFVEIDGPALSLLLCHIKSFVGQHASLIFLTVFALKIRSFQNSFVQQNEPSGLLITKK